MMLMNNMKTPNAKSVSILKNKEMMQLVPYDNYLKEKKVSLPQM